MQIMRTLSVILSLAAMSVLALPAQAAVYKWVDQHGVTRYGDVPPHDAQADKIKGATASTDLPTLTDKDADAATDAEAKEAIRKELEQRDAARVDQRRQNCEQARAEIQQMGDLPARRFRRVDESGQSVRMTEDDQKAHLEKMRTIETENCL